MNLVTEIKLRLAIAAEEEKYNDLIQSFINQVQEKIRNYCNITELPPDLDYVIIQMTIDLLKLQATTLMPDVPAVAEKDVSSIQRGDITIKYNEIKNQDEIIFGYKKELNRYRRIKAV